MLILAIAVVVSMPIGHATNNVHTLYLGSSIVDSCSGKCENLAASTGSADTGTSQLIAKTTGKYQIEPDIASTTSTGTPSTSSVSGYAWVYNTDLGGSTIQSGTWAFDLTIAASTIAGSPVGNVWITVWSCTTNGLGSCTFLFKNWDNSTNVLATTSATKYTYTTGTIGPFSNIRFISVEYWISYTTAGNSAGLVVTETTVSSASDAITPGWNYAQSLSGSLTLASTFAEKSSIFKSLSGSLTLASTFAEKSSIFKSLSSGWTMISGFAEKASLFRSLTGSLSLAGSEIKGLATGLTGSLGSASSFAEKSSLFRSLSGSLSVASSMFRGRAQFLSGSSG